MHSKIQQEKYVLHIRFTQKVGKTSCTDIKKANFLVFLMSKFSKSKFANFCRSYKKLSFALDNNALNLF